ncbi:hypothetical protein ANTRET_LOCUS2530 [Anthophora retusa]
MEPKTQAWDTISSIQSDCMGCNVCDEATSLSRVREIFPQTLVSRRGNTNWPAGSPDLTPMDFFSWGYLKSRVYSSNPRSLIQLKENIRTEMAVIPETVSRSAQKFYFSLRRVLRS